MPGRIEYAGEITQAKSAGRFVQACKMEENICLHWCIEIEAAYPRSLIEKICASDLAVGALLGRIANDELNHVHLLDYVLEGAHVRVRDLASCRDVAERREVLEEVIGELVAGSLADNALELFRFDEAILGAIEVGEALSDALSL